LWVYLHAFWNHPVPVSRVRVLRILFYANLLFFSHEWYADLAARYGAAVFYKPLPLLRLLALDFPPPPVLAVLCGLLWAACSLAMLGVWAVGSAGLAAGLFVLLQAWLFSFEKMDHTFALLTYAALPMPFLLAGRQRALREGQPGQAAWALRLIQLVIGLVYLQTGLEKLLIGGPEWLHPGNVPQLPLPAPGAAGVVGGRVGGAVRAVAGAGAGLRTGLLSGGVPARLGVGVSARRRPVPRGHLPAARRGLVLQRLGGYVHFLHSVGKACPFGGFHAKAQRKDAKDAKHG
jgi:hypothetical protein